jgi:small multidrug resistance pump
VIHYLALGAAILLGVAGQILLKSGAQAETFLAQLVRPQTVFGLGLYVLSAFFYIAALRRLPVAVAFSSVSASYVLVAFFGYFALGESLSPLQFAGIALICGGVALLHYA